MLNLSLWKTLNMSEPLQVCKDLKWVNVHIITAVHIVHYNSLQSAIPTGGPAGTTHFFSGLADGGALLCFAIPSCTIFSTFSSCSRGKGTWCTRRWDPSEGRGTFWNAMCGFGFSCRTHTLTHFKSCCCYWPIYNCYMYVYVLHSECCCNRIHSCIYSERTADCLWGMLN